jgi:hypothetical protein
VLAEAPETSCVVGVDHGRVRHARDARGVEWVVGVVAVTFGAGLSFGALGGVAGAVLTPRLSRLVGAGTIIPIACAASGMALVGFSATSLFPTAALPVFIVAEFVYSMSVTVFNVVQVTFRQRICPPALLGRMTASVRCVVWGVIRLGGIVAAVSADHLGVAGTVLVGGVGSVFACLFLVFSPLVGLRQLPDRTAVVGMEPAQRPGSDSAADDLRSRFDDGPQEHSEPVAVGRGDLPEEWFERCEGPLLDLCGEGVPLRREGDGEAALVVGGGLAFDEAASFGSCDQARRAGAICSERRGQLGHPQLPVAEDREHPQQRQRHVLLGGQLRESPDHLERHPCEQFGEFAFLWC